MPNPLSNTEKFSVVVAAASLAAAALALGLRMTLPPTYADFIVGSVTWSASTKFQDLIAPPLVVGVLFLGVVLLAAQMHALRSHGTEHARDFADQLLWWSVPSVVVIAGLITGTSIDKSMQCVSAAALVILAVSSRWQTGRPAQLPASTVGQGLFAALLIALLPLEFAVALSRAPVSLVGPLNLERYANETYLLGVALFVAVLISVARPGLLLRALPKAVMVGQLGLTLYFLSLYPARLALPDGSLIKYNTTWGLKVLVVVLMLAAVADVVRRYIRYARSERRSYRELFSPLALFGLLIAFKFGNTIGPALSTNDYEFGQTLLGWWSYLKGVVPYVGYIAPHGFMEDDLPGLLSVVFYDGTAASIADATRLGSALLSLVAFLALFEFSGSLGLAFVSTYFIGGRTAFLFFTPFICLWFSRSLRATPARWLAVWLVSAPVVVLGVPPAGLLLAAASGLLVLEALWRMWRGRQRNGWKGLAAVCALLLVLAVATPFARMLFGAIRYVLANGPINQVAYGIPWEFSWNATGVKSGLVFEAIRMSWIAAPAFCLMMVYWLVKQHEIRRPAFLPAVVVLGFSLLLTPYSMGRIDAGDMSRAGLAAIFGWSVLIPVVAWPAIRKMHRGALIVLVAGMSAALNYTTLALPIVVSAASPFIAIGPVKNGADVGMPNVGRAMVQEDQWARLIRLNTLLDSRLPKGVGYLDLTSHNAQTFYFGRPITMSVTAAYNMAPVAQQQRAVDGLSRDVPDIALMSADNIVYDGGGLALRDPVLYRFVIDHYTPVWVDGVVLGYSKRALNAAQDQHATVVAKNQTDDKWDRGVSRSETALLLDAGTPSAVFAVGAPVHLPNGDTRKITRLSADQHVVWLDGAALDPSKAGFPNALDVTVQPAQQPELQAAMRDVAFTTPDLGKIPVAWGRSDRSLSKKMTEVAALDPVTPALRDLSPEGAAFKVTGGNPQLSYDLATLGVSGRRAGLLRFEFSCLGRRAQPGIKLSWWGDQQSGPGDAAKLTFTADDGVLIVPMEAYPRWLTLGTVRGLQISLANPDACGAIAVRHVALYQRNIFR